MAIKKAVKNDKLSMFNWGDSISHNKVPLMNSDNERDYDIFMIDRYLSMHEPFTYVIDLANSVDFRDKYMHYMFLLHGLVKPRSKPFIKYIKIDKPTDELKMVADYYQVNLTVAESYMKRLSPEDLDEIKERLNPDLGGARGKLQKVKKK